MREAGFAVELVRWDDPAVDWPGFDLAVVRSCWDYAWRLEEFLGWAQPGTVRVLFAHWVEPAAGESAAALVSEARVQPVDRRARLRMRALWTLVARFERLIGGEALQVAVRRAAGA